MFSPLTHVACCITYGALSHTCCIFPHVCCISPSHMLHMFLTLVAFSLLYTLHFLPQHLAFSPSRMLHFLPHARCMSSFTHVCLLSFTPVYFLPRMCKFILHACLFLSVSHLFDFLLPYAVCVCVFVVHLCVQYWMSASIGCLHATTHMCFSRNLTADRAVRQ